MKLVIKQWLRQWGGTGVVANIPDTAAAAAALLYEVAISDYHVSTEELAAMERALATVLQLDKETCAALLVSTKNQLDNTTSLHPFTSAINQQFSADEKRQLMLALWKIAYADGKIDKYEEHYLRNIANLLYVPHSVFIQTKLSAAQS